MKPFHGGGDVHKAQNDDLHALLFCRLDNFFGVIGVATEFEKNRTVRIGLSG